MCKKTVFVLILIGFLACEKPIDLIEQQDKELKNIVEYLEKRKLINQYNYNSKGFYYKIIQQGDGSNIESSSIVYGKVKYQKFPFDKVYFSNFETNNKPMVIHLGSSIDILSNLITLIKSKKNIAGKIHAFVPSSLAFGSTGTQKHPIIPPLTTLSIELEIIEFYNETTQLIQDMDILKKINTHKKFVLDTALSLYYHLDNVGQGFNPKKNHKVTLNYSYANVSTPKTLLFDSKGDITIPLNNLPEGFFRAIRLLRPNGKGTFLIPSSLAFGIYGTDKVPPKTNLLLKINLKNIYN